MWDFFSGLFNKVKNIQNFKFIWNRIFKHVILFKKKKWLKNNKVYCHPSFNVVNGLFLAWLYILNYKLYIFRVVFPILGMYTSFLLKFGYSICNGETPLGSTGKWEKKVKGKREGECHLSTFIIDKSRIPEGAWCNRSSRLFSSSTLCQSEGRAEIGESGPHVRAAAHRCWCICVNAGNWANTANAYARNSREDWRRRQNCWTADCR